MREFRFKAAVLGGERRVEVGEAEATLWDGSGRELGRVRYADIVSVRYVDQSVRHSVMRRVDVAHGEELFRVALNGSPGMDPTAPPLSEFYGACAALAAAIAVQRPELEVEIGESRGMRRLWFGMGLFAVLLAVGILVLALATGVASSKLVGGALPLALLALFGALIAHANRPWQPLPKLPVGLMAATFDELREGG